MTFDISWPVLVAAAAVTVLVCAVVLPIVVTSVRGLWDAQARTELGERERALFGFLVDLSRGRSSPPP